MPQMTIWLGFKRTTEHVTSVEYLACGAGRVSCPECDGSGKWPFHPNPAFTDDNCVVCKGTGKILVCV